MGRYLRGLIWLAFIVGLLGAGARAVLFDVWVVPDEPKTAASVAPTLAGGDTVLYFKRSKPAFGDLVRCTDPDDATRFVIGRVAGVPGDTVETNGSDLSVNSKRYTSEFGCAVPRVTIPHPSSGSPVDVACDQVSMGGHPHYRGTSTKATITMPTKTDVGTGMVFLLSDDRSYHDDSRDFGTVRADTCTGRIVFRVIGKRGWSDEKARLSFVQ